MTITDQDDLGTENSSNSPSFPVKLFHLLQKESGSIVEWLGHGLGFKIHDPDKFQAEIIPKYFKHTKITSFQRQLNLYGFRRITKGDDQGAYFHPKFQRGSLAAATSIRRLPGKAHVPNDEGSNRSTWKSLAPPLPINEVPTKVHPISTNFNSPDTVLNERKRPISDQFSESSEYVDAQNGPVKMSKLSMNIGYRNDHVFSSVVEQAHKKPFLGSRVEQDILPFSISSPELVRGISEQSNTSVNTMDRLWLDEESPDLGNLDFDDFFSTNDVDLAMCSNAELLLGQEEITVLP